jgi:bifunctional non-homologous end joining protein LigD
MVSALKAKSFTIDGEAVVAGPDGVAVFDAMHGHRRYKDAFLWGFDLLALNGEDLRRLPLLERKGKLARLLVGSRGGIAFNEHIAAEGAAVFEEARRMGLEGIVCKKRDAPYRSGPSGDWIKVGDPGSAAAKRFERTGGDEALTKE